MNDAGRITITTTGRMTGRVLVGCGTIEYGVGIDCDDVVADAGEGVDTGISMLGTGLRYERNEVHVVEVTRFVVGIYV
jgi:hypothetical protein